MNVIGAVLLAAGFLGILDDGKTDGPTGLAPIADPEVTAREVTVADEDDNVGAGDAGDGEVPVDEAVVWIEVGDAGDEVVLVAIPLDTHEQTASAELSTCRLVSMPHTERTQFWAREEIVLEAAGLHWHA